MDRRKLIYIGSLLILTVIVSVTYFSYAFFTNKSEQRGKINVVAGTLDYELVSNDLTNNSITIPADTTKTIEIEIKSLNTIESKYELYYEVENENVIVGYRIDTIDNPTGTISANSSKKVTVAIKNNTNSPATITFGCQGGFSNKELVLAQGNSITEQMGACLAEIGDTWIFPYNGTDGSDGSEQIFDVTCDGYYKIETWGAQGGSTCSAGAKTGGYGGYASGEIELEIDDRLYIYVGGQPSNNQGYNGGGASSRYQYEDGGGGATDVRYGGNSLLDRIMVAGAGGGCGGYGNGSPRAGDAGGLNSYRGTTNNTGNACYYTFESTQNSGGYPCNSTYPASAVGTFGQGGSSETGGGGGYYGGGGGYNMSPAGSGGSSFVSGHIGCNAISGESTLSNIIHTNQSNHFSKKIFMNTNIVDGQGYTWTNTKGTNTGQIQPDGTTTVGHTGNGYARITYLGNDSSIYVGRKWEYAYANSEQKLLTPLKGTYKLEVWGAQGGNISGYNGGKGGYSYGEITLLAPTELSIYTGGAGVGATAEGQSLAGGYNGGGSVTGNSGVNHITGSGGGATHIATVSGKLSALSSQQDKVLIVAGGGGGARNQSNHIAAARWGQGGAGGGLTSGGAYSNFNTTTVTKMTACLATQTVGYAFGQGEAGNANSAGGGGFMGGYAGAGECGTYLGSGSGGSGYIGTLDNAASLDGENTFPSPTGTNEIGHSGNGYARITYLGNN